VLKRIDSVTIKLKVMKKLGLLILSLLPLQFAFATQHIIHFSNDSTCSYAPANLDVNVGDTIIWVGDFSTCPITSEVVPTGARDFANSDADTYMYVVRVAGVYDYVSPGFGKSTKPAEITASGDALVPVQDNSSSMRIVQEQGLNVLYSTISTNPNTTRQSSDYVLSIFDVTGNLKLTTTIDVGNNRFVLPQMTTGIYLVRVADAERVYLAQQIWQP
jgi:hypothetical protein